MTNVTFGSYRGDVNSSGTEPSRLIEADETLYHQVVDTFATVASTDVNWTEKVWTSVGAHDGSVQVAFGLGKYPNRGVLDAYGGVSRAVEQWTVRASRALWLDPHSAAVGPLHYEVIEPLATVRVALEATDIQPIAFDVTLTGACPPGLEAREILQAPDSRRVTNDVMRYHQAGSAHGWVDIDGDRFVIHEGTWSSARDHSWGIRNTVGSPAKDLAPTRYPSDPRSFTSWQPVRCVRADGSHYVIFHYFQESNFPGQPAHKLLGGIEYPDGSVETFNAARWIDTRFDDTNRRFLGGTFVATMPDGAQRPIAMTPVDSGTGFHLGTGLYFGLDGARHGQWRGELHVDGDHFTDCAAADVARRIHQLRDCLVRVDDPVGGGVGYGVLQTIAIGAFPEFGLALATTFI